MGYLNSVGIAQHIHRVIVRRALANFKGMGLPMQEIRRDRVFSSCPNLFRVYLDNFDQLQQVDRATAALISGSPSPFVEQLREYYSQNLLPRHPKKSVEQALEAEVQGSWVDGVSGTITAKPSKVAKYIKLALEVIGRGRASQRELQVVGGGFVYVAMFRRPLLASLNQIWRSIVEEPHKSPHVRFWIRREVMVELVRFIGLCPLSFINLRSPFDEMVTASDASLGGGVCRSIGLTPYGQAAGQSSVRRDIVDEEDLIQVLSVGMFDGIGALRVALDVLRAPVAGHISIERNAEARRVVEANFPDSECVEDVEDVTDELVHQWSLKYSTVGVVLIGSGPPCQGVSGLNFDRKGALKDLRSRLFQHVPRVTKLCKRHFPWAQVQSLTENVASMDARDCQTMSDAFDSQPWFIDSAGISLAHRPRLYWISWELQEQDGVEIYWGSDGALPLLGEVRLQGLVDENAFLDPGWKCKGDKPLPTFTTSRPSPNPLRRPAGLKDCDEDELKRWRDDQHRFPPYQYKACNSLVDTKGNLRTPNSREREVILGFPPNYTKQCMKKSEHGRAHHEDCRLTLTGNSWSVGVVAWLLNQLLYPLGITSEISLQQIIDRITPGKATDLQSLLLRPPLKQGTHSFSPSAQLVQKLSGLVSLKGEDLMLQGASEIPVKYQRLRAGVPAKLWRWGTVAGWQWGGETEHINVLEARAVLTTIKWQVSQRQQVNLRCVHLVDSLVVLHALTRTFLFQKDERTVMRISAYLLASGLQPIWAYVDTKENPADRPSRRGGEGRATASTFLAALQDYMPKLKHHLPGSWRLMKTWATHETPSPAPPLTEAVVQAMVGDQWHESISSSFEQVQRKQFRSAKMSLRFAFRRSGLTPDDAFQQVARGNSTISKEDFLGYVATLPEGQGDVPVTEEQASMVFDDFGKFGMKKINFLKAVQEYGVCSKEVTMTSSFTIENSERIRKLLIGENVEILEGSKEDDEAKVQRVRCRALKDGKEGWVTVKGNQGTSFLKPKEPCLRVMLRACHVKGI
eukprot:s548_g28.t1